MISTRMGQTGGSAAPASPSARLKRERTVLLVVDMQERLLPAIHESERVLRNVRMLVAAAQVLEVPTVLTTQYRKGLGEIVAEVSQLLPGATAIDKLTFSCFGSEAVAEWFVQRPARDQLLLAGIESHVCVAQTAMNALERGLLTHVAADAIGSRIESNHRIGLTRMQQMGAVVSSAEMAIYELLESAETEAFRKILPLVKG